MYDYEEIKKILITKNVSRNFIQFDFLDSLSKKCLKICENCPNGMLVLCETQANVKITKNKIWESNNRIQYLFSLIMDKSENADYVNIMQRSVVLSLNKLFSIEAFNFNETNDIFIDDDKIGAVFINHSKRTKVNKDIVSCYLNKDVLLDMFEEIYEREKIDEKIIATISNYFETLIGI